MPLNSFTRWAHPKYYFKNLKKIVECFYIKWNQRRGARQYSFEFNFSPRIRTTLVYTSTDTVCSVNSFGGHNTKIIIIIYTSC